MFMHMYTCLEAVCVVAIHGTTVWIASGDNGYSTCSCMHMSGSHTWYHNVDSLRDDAYIHALTCLEAVAKHSTTVCIHVASGIMHTCPWTYIHVCLEAIHGTTVWRMLAHPCPWTYMSGTSMCVHGITCGAMYICVCT